jgi:hypothetical protein
MTTNQEVDVTNIAFRMREASEFVGLMIFVVLLASRIRLATLPKLFSARPSPHPIGVR